MSSPAALGGDGSGFPHPRPEGLGRTRRARLRALLLETEEGLPLDVIERLLEATRSTIIADLEHLRLSFRHQDATLLMVPPSCTDCGYTFRLDVPKAPSRCPACKSRDLSQPIFKALAEA
jgi:transcriptional regulator